MARFQKGQSGNPGGRPKALLELKSLAQEKSPEAFKRICELMKSKDERVALAAAQEVLNRGFGKPTQHIEGNVRHSLIDILAGIGAQDAVALEEEPEAVRH